MVTSRPASWHTGHVTGNIAKMVLSSLLPAGSTAGSNADRVLPAKTLLARRLPDPGSRVSCPGAEITVVCPHYSS